MLCYLFWMFFLFSLMLCLISLMLCLVFLMFCLLSHALFDISHVLFVISHDLFVISYVLFVTSHALFDISHALFDIFHVLFDISSSLDLLHYVFECFVWSPLVFCSLDCFSLWVKYASHFFWFSCGILFFLVLIGWRCLGERQPGTLYWWSKRKIILWSEKCLEYLNIYIYIFIYIYI